MKKTINFWLYPFIITGLLFFLASSCKKDNKIISTPTPTYKAFAVHDTDGNGYHSVKIYNQEWIQENLKTTKFNDGVSIPLVKDKAAWAGTTTPAYCLYNNLDSNKNTYGFLYNWYAVSTGKLCPKGWHVPSDSAWTKLTDSLGGLKVAGGKMKEISTLHWKEPNLGATNQSAFWALPGGIRLPNGNFQGLVGTFGYWWSSTEYYNDFGYGRYLTYNYADIWRWDYHKKHGLSVRCIRD